MSFIKTTDLLVELCEEILQDIPKVIKGNKSAAQRIRTKTIKLAKTSKDWRKLSLDKEKKLLKKRKPNAAKPKKTKQQTRRKKS